MTDDPQHGCPRGMWMHRDGLVYIDDMTDIHLINCYKTATRHNNPKATELMRELKHRNIDWRI